MENGNKAIKTEIKYEITSCYFCSEFLDNDNFKVSFAFGKHKICAPNSFIAFQFRQKFNLI